MHSFAILRRSRGLLGVWCSVVHFATAAVVIGSNSSENLSLFSRGVCSGSKVLISNGKQEKRRLFVGVNGQEWRELFVPGLEKSALRAVTALADGTWLVQGQKSLWISRDHGGGWSALASPPSVILKSDPLAIAELSRLGAMTVDAGSAKLAASSVDGIVFESFTSVSITAPQSAVAAVQFRGKYGGDTFALVKTSDAGRRWQWLVKEGGFLFDGSGNYLAHHIFFLSQTTGWISSDYLDDIYHTKDGGATWKMIKAPDRVVSAIYFKNEQHGRIIGGSTARVYESTDGGTNWHELTDAQVLAPYFVNYFGAAPEEHWNEFAVYRFVLENAVLKRQSVGIKGVGESKGVR